MRVALVLLVLAVGCKGSKKEPAENHDPYRNVTPAKVKEKVEAAQKQEEQRDDKLLEQAK